jgi:formate/nitrite transporter FocA (FNT family)
MNRRTELSTMIGVATMMAKVVPWGTLRRSGFEVFSGNAAGSSIVTSCVSSMRFQSAQRSNYSSKT